jgi:hypothetical protein
VHTVPKHMKTANLILKVMEDVAMQSRGVSVLNQQALENFRSSAKALGTEALAKEHCAARSRRKYACTHSQFSCADISTCTVQLPKKFALDLHVM